MRKDKKKMAAIGLTCILASGLLIGNIDYATHTFAATRIAAAEVKTVAEKIVENAAQKKAAEGVTKEESVYVTLDANGQRQDVVVSDWLKNSGIGGTLKDESDLDDIQNTKGNEQFTQDGESLSWEAEDQDIYYQGTTEKELPVSMEITYKLDGEEISPEELAGKSGKLEMTIHYSNHSKKNVKVAGETKKVYTPFVMATGMILPVEKFTNVQVDNGQVLSEGANDIVAVYGMPGLKESLDLDNLDFGDDVSVDLDKVTEKITDTATITADVTEFELGQTYTIATASIFQDIDFGDLNGADDLDDKMDDLTDATEELVNGSDKIQENLRTLDSKFDTYAEAVGTLKSSVKTLNNGGQKINAAAKKYTNSTDKLLGAVNTYVDGAKTFSKSTKTYSQSTKKLVEGVGQLYSAASPFPKSYEEFHTQLDTYTTGVNTLLSEENMTSMTDATASLKSGVENVDKGLKQVQSGVAAINQGASALSSQDTAALIQGLQAIAASGDVQTSQVAQMAIAYIQGAEQLAASINASTNGVPDGTLDDNGTRDLAAALAQLEAATDTESADINLYTGISALDQSAKEISENAKTLRGYKTPIMDASGTISESVGSIASNLNTIYKSGQLITANNKKLENAADSISKNANKIKKNSKKLTASSGSFRKATKSLASGTSKLLSGVQKLAGSTGQVSDGISKLSDGALDLYDGMKQFQEEGTGKLVDTVSSLLDGGDDLQNRAKAVNKAAENYKSFSGVTDEMDGSVKFIMTTQEIKAEK